MIAVLNDEQRMLAESVNAFLADAAPVSHLRNLRDERDDVGFSRSLWRQFADQGYCATMVPEAHGGLGLGVVEATVVGEALGRTLTPSPFLSTGVLAARILANAGSDAQQQAWLPAIASAGTVIALAVDERSKHAPESLATTIKRSGSGFRIDGTKTFVIDAHVADRLIVAGQNGDGGIALALVDPKAAGVEIERTVMVDAHNAARIKFNGVQLGADALIGGDGAATLEDALDVGRLVVAAELLGVAEETFNRTLAYVKERKQFDRLIGEFQALQHRAAVLYIDIELSRAMLLQAAQAYQADPSASRRMVSQAKDCASRLGNLAVREGVQMHGGIGMTDAIDVGLFMKRARVLQELFGDAGYHADRAARLAGY